MAKKKKKTDDRIERRALTRKLPVDLTKDEVVAAGRKHIEAEQRAEAHEIETKLFKEKRKAELAVHVDAAMKYRRMMLDEKEDRDVDCELRLDFNTGTKYVVRLDTGEIIEGPVSMTDEDRQRSLLGDDVSKSIADEQDDAERVEDASTLLDEDAVVPDEETAAQEERSTLLDESNVVPDEEPAPSKEEPASADYEADPEVDGPSDDEESE